MKDDKRAKNTEAEKDDNIAERRQGVCTQVSPIPEFWKKCGQ